MSTPSPLIASHETVGHDADGAAGFNEQGMTTVPETNSDTSSVSSWFNPFTYSTNYFRELSSYFTPLFLCWMAISQFCVCGGVYALVLSLSLPLFKQLGVSASTQQLYTTMITSPWAMKPFIGVASDLFLIRGYNKRFVGLFSIIVGLTGCAVLLVMFHSEIAIAIESSEVASHGIVAAIVLASQPSALKHPH
ncbi:hypothetical protein ACHAWO_008072 [Cyclotella atomus]|uniref:Uncharacterized protein n=1 Tax=Cyclotella atomus TaxID=382360 RepID=A0ABD3MRK4_9STRA